MLMWKCKDKGFWGNYNSQGIKSKNYKLHIVVYRRSFSLSFKFSDKKNRNNMKSSGKSTSSLLINIDATWNNSSRDKSLDPLGKMIKHVSKRKIIFFFSVKTKILILTDISLFFPKILRNDQNRWHLIV